MKFKDRSFPYPIILPYNNDYETTTFDINITYEVNSEMNELKIKLISKLDNETLLQLIESNDLSYVVHLEESRTMFREIIKFNENEHTHTIKLDKVRSSIEVVPMIVANNNIDEYWSSDQSSYFMGSKFEIEKNSIVGFGNPKEIEVLKDLDDLQHVGSIFIVTPDRKIKSIYKIEYQERYISINISEKDYEIYNSLSNIYRLSNSQENKILLSIFVLPVFVEVLNLIKTNGINFDNKVWYKSIVKAYENKDIKFEEELKKETFDSYQYAQIIFNDIISESVNKLYQIRSEDL